MTDLWSEASRDLEAEHLALRRSEAKVVVADLWPFLSLARSDEEFGHRVALAQELLTSRVPADLMDATLASLREDFHAERAEAAREQAAAKTAAVTPEPVPQAGQQFWHEAQRRWITVSAASLPGQPETRDNPYGSENYFEDAAAEGAEAGPNTGQTGQYPQFPAGPDPVDPLNGMFPMQPSAWTVPPDAGWVERPMRFSSAADLARLAAHRVVAGAGYTSEGVETGTGQEPTYFAGGSEGIGGDPQPGYPADLATEDPDDRMNEIYGGVPPQPSSGSAQGGAGPYSNPGVARQGVRHTAPGGGEHAPYRIKKVDGGYAVFNAKGERKNDEPKSKEDARQFQQALYKNVPGARESAEADESRKAASFSDPRDAGVRVTAQDAPGAPDAMGGLDAGVQPPPTMLPGGPGTEAQPPMAAGPSSSNPGDPFGTDQASKAQGMNVAAFARVAADNIRQRPTDVNPTGVADEYDDNTWEGQANTRPRQPSAERGVNTPQTPRDPIPQSSSSDAELERGEDERRLAAASFARRVVLTGGF